MTNLRMMAVDDEPLALGDLTRAIEAEVDDCSLQSFLSPVEALDYARSHTIDVAFCDIEMPGINGLAFAKSLKDLHPEVHIVFVTSFENYALDAFALHATGYLLKPVDAEELRRELTFIYERHPHAHTRIQARTFGGFEVKVDGKPLAFKRSKAKELMALLIDRRGAGISSREACAALWEDEPYGATQRSYYQTAVADLRAALAAAGAEDVLVKSWNSLAVNPEAVDCDLYRFLAGDPIAVNEYRHDYLPAYSWAEFSIGRIEEEGLRRR